MNNFAKLAEEIPFMNSAGVVSIFDNLLEDCKNAPCAINKIFEIIGERTDYFMAPASSKFHLAKPQGLLTHSVGVTVRLLALLEAYGFPDTVIRYEVYLVGLLHDLGKAGQYSLSGNKPYYLYNSHGGSFFRNKSLISMSVPLSSLYFISSNLSELWKPSITAWTAIAYHDGQYVPEGAMVANSETALGLALHQADMWQSRVESEWKNG